MRFSAANAFCFVSMLCIGSSFAQIPVFQDIAPAAGVDNSEMAMGAAFLDVNNDGWDDIHLINDHQPGFRNFLYLNQCDMTFTDITLTAGVAEPQFPFAVRVADVDNDGWQDLFIFTMDGHNMLYRNNHDNTFTDMLPPSVVCGLYLSAADVGDVNNDGLLDLYVVVRDFWNFYGILYQNIEHGEFNEVWRSSAPLWFANDANFCDFDNDGDLDLLQGNFGSPNWLFRIEYPAMNEIAQSAGIAGYPEEFKHPLVGDFDNDGWFDIFCITYLEYGETAECLYRQDSPMHFANIINASGIDPLAPSYRGVVADLDNDGWLDIVTFDSNSGSTYFWHNDGDGTFTDVASEAGLTLDNSEACAAAVGDINADGFLDIYLMKYGSGNSPNRLFLNGGNGNHWLQIALRGSDSNGLGLGSRVKAVAGDLVQWRDVGGGRGESCSNAPYVQLGLGSHSVVDSLYVMWSSGRMDMMTDLPADQRITVVEGSVSVGNSGQNSLPVSFRLQPAYPNPFNPTTTLGFTIPNDSQVNLSVYDIAGRKVATLVNGMKSAGTYQVTFDGSGLASGVYFCRLEAGEYSAAQKMVLMK